MLNQLPEHARIFQTDNERRRNHKLNGSIQSAGPRGIRLVVTPIFLSCNHDFFFFLLHINILEPWTEWFASCVLSLGQKKIKHFIQFCNTEGTRDICTVSTFVAILKHSYGSNRVFSTQKEERQRLFSKPKILKEAKGAGKHRRQVLPTMD